MHRTRRQNPAPRRTQLFPIPARRHPCLPDRRDFDFAKLLHLAISVSTVEMTKITTCRYPGTFTAFHLRGHYRTSNTHSNTSVHQDSWTASDAATLVAAATTHRRACRRPAQRGTSAGGWVRRGRASCSGTRRLRALRTCSCNSGITAERAQRLCERHT